MTLLIAIIIAVLGAVLGSFFNVLIDRVPRGESVVNPPSHCTSCGKQLPPGQNIPIYTYLAQKETTMVVSCQHYFFEINNRGC